MIKILHTEASLGWGGQEIRILREAEGMRKRGHDLTFATAPGAVLACKARNSGFQVYEIPFSKTKPWRCLPQLLTVFRSHEIDIVNTHSSLDSWVAGVAARISGRKIVRTRHLSATIRPGLNSQVLYNWLTDGVVTTCESIAQVIRQQAGLCDQTCLSIPTGVNPQNLQTSPPEVEEYRQRWGLTQQDVVAGTVCVLRSWKGVSDLILAAHLLRDNPHLKWLVVGDGPCNERYRNQARELNLEKQVIFTGYEENPGVALAALDIFLLLSTANEGVSQASLQAGFLGKPLITTSIGGLPEVCLHQTTGYLVSPKAPLEVAEHVTLLAKKPEVREELGCKAHKHVKKNFTFEQTLNGMEKMYYRALGWPPTV